MSSESLHLSFCCCYIIFYSLLQLSKEFLKLQIFIVLHLLMVCKMSPSNSTLNACFLVVAFGWVLVFFFLRPRFSWLHSYVLCCCRMSATKWGRYLPRNCIRHLWNYCSLWNIWQSLLCVPKTLWKREEHMPDSACSKTSVYEENILSRILWLTVSISVKLLRTQQSNTKLEGVIIKT